MARSATGQDHRIAEAEAALDAGLADQALGLADSVLAETGPHGPALKLRARALEALGNLPAALAAWTDARDAVPQSAGFRVDRAKLLFRLGRHDESLAEHEAAVTLDPLQLEGWKGMLALRPVHPDEDGLAEVAASIDDPSRSARLRAKAAFVLGQILSESGQHDAAFDRYAQANAIVAQGAAPDDLEYRFPPGAFGIDGDFIGRHAPKLPHLPPCPAILIAGLPRSGKSMAESFVAADPAVRAGDELAVLARHARGYDWSQGADMVALALAQLHVSPVAPLYIAQLQGHRRVTDTAPTNLFRLGFLGLLHPEVPVVLCSRGPLDLGAAMFFKQFRRGNLFTASLPSLGRALARAERMMAHLVKTLPNPVLHLRYEETVADPQSAAKALAALCGTQPAVPVGGAEAIRLSAGRSLGFGTVEPGLVGFADPFRRHFAPMLAAYEAERHRLIDVGR